MSKILFQVPATLMTACEIPEYQQENGWLKILMHPLEYKRQKNMEGDAPYEYTSSGVFSPVRIYTLRLELRIAYGAANILYLFEQLCLFSNTSGNHRHTPLTIRDYVRPEFPDRTIGYTERKGAIASYEEDSGMILGFDGKYYQHGFSVVFEQLGKKHF